MNPLLTPELGTYVWSLVIFLTVLFVLKKYAWNPLLDFLEEREKDIAESLEMAESAKTNLEKIKDESEKILNKAKKEGKLSDINFTNIEYFAFDVTNKEIANLFDIQYQTSLLIFKGNKEVYRSIGETTKDLIYEAIKTSI